MVRFENDRAAQLYVHARMLGAMITAKEGVVISERLARQVLDAERCFQGCSSNLCVIKVPADA